MAALGIAMNARAGTASGPRRAAVALAALALVGASFASLDLQWSAFLGADALGSMGRFAAEFLAPDLGAAFLRRVLGAAGETLAMSALGTALAAAAALLLCLPAARRPAPAAAPWRLPVRLVLNALRAVPELVWAAMLLVIAGLGPMAGTLALALHTSGVLGRLFAEAVENAAPGPAFALRCQGVREGQVLLYATLPQIAPQLLSYVLYRWENNIRAATVLGVVGAGGLGQMLVFHLGLFQMGRTATVVLAMIVLVLGVDLLSYALRRALVR
jgi:phosphonate transport system permease protein